MYDAFDIGIGRIKWYRHWRNQQVVRVTLVCGCYVGRPGNQTWSPKCIELNGAYARGLHERWWGANLSWRVDAREEAGDVGRYDIEKSWGQAEYLHAVVPKAEEHWPEKEG